MGLGTTHVNKHELEAGNHWLKRQLLEADRENRVLRERVSQMQQRSEPHSIFKRFCNIFGRK